MATNSWIGIANGIGFRNRSGGGYPPLPDWFKTHLVCWYDVPRQKCTNESMSAMADPILKDYNPNPRGVGGTPLDLHLKNFNWEGMSGIGGYGNSLFNSNDGTNIKVVKQSSFKETITFQKEYSIGGGILISPNKPFNKVLLTIKSSKNNSTIIFRILDSTYNIIKDTFIKPNIINEITFTNDEISKIYRTYITANVGKGEIWDLEILPLYPNALVFDGVDDYGISEGQPILDDYTVMAQREWITLPTGNGSGFATKRVSNNEASFCIERALSNTLRVLSYGEMSAVDTPSSDIVVQSKNKYNGIFIKSGKQKDTDRLTLGRIALEYNLFAKFALSRFLLFDRTLTQEEEDWVRYYIMGERVGWQWDDGENLLWDDGTPILTGEKPSITK